jgi:hypothetical protein
MSKKAYFVRGAFALYNKGAYLFDFGLNNTKFKILNLNCELDLNFYCIIWVKFNIHINGVNDDKFFKIRE